jgi:exodeoxyribonuclease V alpha subunit
MNFYNRTKSLSQISSNPVNTNEITGKIDKIIFQKDGFVIMALCSGQVVKGNMIAPNMGTEYIFRGKVTNSKFGKQLQFDEYETIAPSDDDAVKSYLISTAKWVGLAIADEIVKLFGDEALDVCKNHPEKLHQIRGITQGRAEEISRVLRDNEEMEKLQIELKRLFDKTGAPKSAIVQVIKMWKSDSIDKVRENPYALIDNIKGIGFLVADRIARRTGIAIDSPDRVMAGIVYTLKNLASQSGHTCYPIEYFWKKVKEILREPEVTKALIEFRMASLVERKILVVQADNIYLMGYYNEERLVAKKLIEIMGYEEVLPCQ